jgi:hypothetical protein
MTSCLTGFDQSALQINTKIVSSHTADSKPIKQEVNSTMILPPLVFPGFMFYSFSNHILPDPFLTNFAFEHFLFSIAALYFKIGLVEI